MAVELSDEQYALMNGAYKLMDQLASGKTQHQFQHLVKQVHPSVVTDADKAAPLIDAVKKVNAKVDQTINYLRSKEIDGNLSNQFAKIRKDFGYTDEGIEEVKKLMVAEKIASPEAAAALYDRRLPKPEPQTPSLFSPNDWGFGRLDADEDNKLLWSNEDAWAAKQTEKVLREYARGQIED